MKKIEIKIFFQGHKTIGVKITGRHRSSGESKASCPHGPLPAREIKARTQFSHAQCPDQWKYKSMDSGLNCFACEFLAWTPKNLRSICVPSYIIVQVAHLDKLETKRSSYNEVCIMNNASKAFVDKSHEATVSLNVLNQDGVSFFRAKFLNKFTYTCIVVILQAKKNEILPLQCVFHRKHEPNVPSH